MLTRKQDLSSLALYYCGYSTIANMLFRLQGKTITRFVIFHHIGDEFVGGFKANLAFLKRKMNVVSFQDYCDGKLSSEQLNVVITFDDGYKSWITHAMPLLKDLGLPATFFVSSGFVGLSRKEEQRYLRSQLMLNPDRKSRIGGLRVEDLKRLVGEGFTIGGHSVNHYNLGNLHDAIAVKDEIYEDKKNLESMTGDKVEYFAYPFGSYQNVQMDLADIVKQAGYKAAVTTVGGYNTISTNPFVLHREITDASMAGWVFRSRVYGNYDAVRAIKKKVSSVTSLDHVVSRVVEF